MGTYSLLASPAALLLFAPTTNLPVAAAAQEDSAPRSETNTNLTHHSLAHLSAAQYHSLTPDQGDSVR